MAQPAGFLIVQITELESPQGAFVLIFELDLRLGLFFLDFWHGYLHFDAVVKEMDLKGLAHDPKSAHEYLNCSPPTSSIIILILKV